jgi:hypothetical protein
MEQLFSSLRKAGIGRSNLYPAWDFTVASERSLTARMLTIRDDAFAQLGAGGTGTPPNEDIPPRPPAYGADPHSYPRNDVKARAQKSDFLQIGGVVNNYCTNSGTPSPCHSHGWLGP